MIIKLSAAQTIAIHGMFPRTRILKWQDVVEREDLTFDSLVEMNFTTGQLYNLQSDPSEWARHKKIGMKHVLQMQRWKMNPITHLKCDLFELLSQQWDVSTLKHIGVDYQDLLDIGLTAEIMPLFGFNLMGWMSLNFTREHMRTMKDHQIVQVFGMTKMQVEKCFGKQDSDEKKYAKD